MAAIAKRMRTDRIQINSVSRPPAEARAKPPSSEVLAERARLFEGNVELVPGFSGIQEEHEFMVGKARVLDLLDRRPHTLEEISSLLFLNPNEALKLLEGLLHEGMIASTFEGDVRRFSCKTL